MNGYFVRAGMNAVNPRIVNIRCPYCHHQGAFHGLHNVQDLSWNQVDRGPQPEQRQGGIRLCPNPECRGLVFVVIELLNNKIDILPPETIDFDASNLPKNILETLEEAIKCHGAGCYRASAMMVRRLLEELCKDKGAGGKTLNVRLKALGASVVLPAELLAATDELRLLGNDAAHVEANTYDDIAKPEAEVALLLAKELLKAVYQYAALLGRLQALKRQKP